MNIWILYFCAGITGWGCGAVRLTEFPNEESCYKALASMKTTDQPVVESGLRRSMVAYCYPKPKELK